MVCVGFRSLYGLCRLSRIRYCAVLTVKGCVIFPVFMYLNLIKISRRQSDSNQLHHI